MLNTNKTAAFSSLPHLHLPDLYVPLFASGSEVARCASGLLGTSFELLVAQALFQMRKLSQLIGRCLTIDGTNSTCKTIANCIYTKL